MADNQHEKSEFEILSEQNKKMLEQRDKDMNDRCDAFLRATEKDSTMTLEEFEEFRPLFSLENLKSLDERVSSPSKADIEANKVLSNKLAARVNPRRPFHVVDSKGEKILSFPPIHVRIPFLDNVEAIAALAASTQRPIRDILTERREMLYQQLILQDQEKVFKEKGNVDINKQIFEKYANGVHEKIDGPEKKENKASSNNDKGEASFDECWE